MHSWEATRPGPLSLQRDWLEFSKPSCGLAALAELTTGPYAVELLETRNMANYGNRFHQGRTAPSAQRIRTGRARVGNRGVKGDRTATVRHRAIQDDYVRKALGVLLQHLKGIERCFHAGAARLEPYALKVKDR
jgi:hypothetical protein